MLLNVLVLVAARLVENIAEIASTIANFLERIGMSREEADKTVIVIQTAFRKYLAMRPQARPNGIYTLNNYAKKFHNCYFYRASRGTRVFNRNIE